MLFNWIPRFLQLEAASGMFLFISALIAIVLDNTSGSVFYQAIISNHFGLYFGSHAVIKPVLFWINEGLMTIFFLLVGLELKREFCEGELSGLPKIALPGFAALGGMIIPALIYVLFNHAHPEALKGWSVPVATDIAFALGVLSLFGKRVPIGLKLFLMALAIFDDLGAIVIIALFYTHGFLWLPFILGVVLLGLLFLLNRAGIKYIAIYIVLGMLLWCCLLKTGIHPTIAGVVLAFFIPLHPYSKGITSPLHRLEHALHPWVAYLVMPLFAFANAGVSFTGLSPSILTDSLVLGIAAGLFIGKQIGVFSFALAAIKLRFATLPEKVTLEQLYAVALLCGIGFTMSLFLGTLAFQGDQAIYIIEVRCGVLLGSMLSGIIGAIVLKKALR